MLLRQGDGSFGHPGKPHGENLTGFADRWASTMARHIRLAGIVDLILVSEPTEIRAFNEEPRIDRNFIPRGPLINRLILARI